MAAPRRVLQQSGDSIALLCPRHARPLPQRPPPSALDLAEPRCLRRSRRQVLALLSVPSPRTTGTPRSTVSRHLAQLAQEGVIARQRRPGGVYAYTIASRFLPAPIGGCPTSEIGVSHRREQKNRQVRKPKAAQRAICRSGVSFGEIPDENDNKWQARLRSWRQSRFWLPLWGAKLARRGA